VSAEIVISIPARFRRANVLRQLEHCQDNIAWHYMVDRLPRDRDLRRMHFVHDGELIGSLPISGIENVTRRLALVRADGSHLPMTRDYAILACGTFRRRQSPIPMRGFRGWRYFTGKCPTCRGLGCDFDDAGREELCPICNGTGDIHDGD
jgi:hypothetical protein